MAESSEKRKSPRRSKLVTLAQNRQELERAAKSGADIVQINMEDGVPIEGKADARKILIRALHEIDWGGAERWIKINPLVSGETERDIEALTEAKPEAFILAKLQTPEEVQLMAKMVDKAEQRAGVPSGTVSLVASIERIRALSRVEDISTCHERITAIQFGPTDMSYELGYRLDRTGQSFETLYARSRCVLAGRLAGIDIGDGPYWLHQDHLGTLRSAMWTFQLGFTHKACHTAEQVPIVHQAFEMMSDPQADWAARYLGEVHH